MDPFASREKRDLTLKLAVMLFDRFTRKNNLAGLYAEAHQEEEEQARADATADTTRLERYTTVRMAGRKGVPYRKESEATFLFFDLDPGSYTVRVRSPYYLSREIPSIVVPMPNAGWPAFPDVTLANENLALDGPGQPPAYRAQRALASLQPSARYPFPPTATLVRGTVRASGASLAGATVRRAGQAQEYLTGADGEYVLFFSDIKGTGQAITLEAAHPLHTSASVNVTSVRGMTVLKDITLA